MQQLVLALHPAAGTNSVSAPHAFCSAASAGNRSSKQVMMPSFPTGVSMGENGLSPARTHRIPDSRRHRTNGSCGAFRAGGPRSSRTAIVLYGRPSVRSYMPAAIHRPYLRQSSPSAIMNGPSHGSAASIFFDRAFTFCVIHAVFRQKQHFRSIFRCRLCKAFYFPEIGSFVLPAPNCPMATVLTPLSSPCRRPPMP